MFCNIPFIPPDDSFCIISWTFMGQVAAVVVVPIEVGVMATAIPPSPKIPFSTVAPPFVIVPVSCGKSLPVVLFIPSIQRVCQTGGICVISGDTEPVQRTWFYPELMVHGNVGLVLEVFQLHQKLPGSRASEVGHGL